MTGPGDLAGRRALVTASSEGLGRATARRLALDGADVAISGRRPDVLEAARAAIAAESGRTVAGLDCDLARPDQVRRLVDRAAASLGGLDILVFNTGHIPYGGLLDLDEAQWYEGFELLLMSAVRLATAAVPVLRRAGGGDVVFIGSATVREPTSHLLLSSVMRLGVAGLAKTMARDYAADGIRVNLVSPGYFDTGRVARRVDAVVAETGPDRREAATTIASEVPLGRIGRAEELAETIAFVVSRRAAFMTGANLQLDGGAGRSIL